MVEIVDLGGPRDRASILLGTRLGTPIRNVRRRPQAPATMMAALRLHTSEHPSLKLRSLASEYNCMGLVFASRRTWIEIDHLPMILKEDEYRQIPPKEVQVGDVLVYRDDRGEVTHIGIVFDYTPDVQAASFATRVLSQWGADGEYFHDAEDVTHWLGRPREFWTERRP